MGLGDVSIEVGARGLYESQARVAALQQAVRVAAFEATDDATEYAADVIRRMTPIGEGEGRGGVRSHDEESGPPGPHLVTGWFTRVRGVGPEMTGEIINRMDYAAAVEEGAAPRVIRVRRKKYLWWPSIANSRLKRVDWPGFGGRHMGSRGLNEAAPGVFRRYNQAVERAVRRIFG